MRRSWHVGQLAIAASREENQTMTLLRVAVVARSQDLNTNLVVHLQETGNNELHITFELLKEQSWHVLEARRLGTKVLDRLDVQQRLLKERE